MRPAHAYWEDPRVARRHLERLVDLGLSPQNRRVLDMGCGTGTYSQLLAEMGARQVLGVDREPRNIELARSRQKTAGVTFRQGDIEQWRPWGNFDLIFMRGTIYYLQAPPERVLRYLKGLLLPGGQLYLTFMDRTPRALAVNLLKRLAASLPTRLQPALRRFMARLYFYLVRCLEAGEGDLAGIEDKMSTLFFPLRWFTPPSQAKAMLQATGFQVVGVITATGEHSILSDDYGVLATLPASANSA